MSLTRRVIVKDDPQMKHSQVTNHTQVWHYLAQWRRERTRMADMEPKIDRLWTTLSSTN